jgi:type IV secretory pathway VirB4 component
LIVQELNIENTFIDEAHLFLNREFTREFYIRLQKTARKRQAGVVSITQNAEDYREEMGAKTILTQAETVILLKQHTASVNFLMNLKIFDLSEREFNDLYSLEQGQAILFREQEHINIQIKPFENEWEFIKT